MIRLFLPKITDRFYWVNTMEKDQVLTEGMEKFQRLFNYNAKVGLNETTLLGNEVEEADDNAEEAPAPDPNAAPAPDPSMGGAPAPDPSMGGAPAPDPSMGGAPAPDPSMGGTPADPSMGGDPSASGEAPTPEGFNPQDAAGDLSNADFDAANTEQPGDEVLDVTELTDKQEDIEKEVGEIGGKFDKVMKALGAFEELLRANDRKIEDLKAEYEKRNPTQIEKLSMQTAKSYPFNVTPEEFWKEKEATSNYSTEDDDNGKEQGQYQITANDIAGATDWKSISDSLDDDDFMYNQTLAKVMSL